MTKKVETAAKYLFAKYTESKELYNVGDDLFLDDIRGFKNSHAALVQLNFKEENTGRKLKKMVIIKRSDMVVKKKKK